MVIELFMKDIVKGAIMYGAIYKCKMCGKEFLYINPGEKEEMERFDPLEEWDYTPYGAPFPEDRISGKKNDPPQFTPHYCNSNDSTIGMAELIGFKEMAEQIQYKKRWSSMNSQEKQRCLQDEFDFHGIEECDYLPVIEFILQDGFDMTGWRLNEIPIGGQYCFFKKDTNQCFDINVNKGLVTAQYMDSKEGEYYDKLFDAESIEVAVSKYNWPEADVYPVSTS